MFNFDALQTLLRAVLKIGGGFLLAKGLADENTVETITAGALALAAVVWGVLHRSPSGKGPGAAVGLFFVVGSSLMLLAGCASANTIAFRTEKLATEAAYASLLAWKAYYNFSLTNSPPEDLPALMNRNEDVFSASRRFAAVMQAADSLREACATNAAASNRTALSVALEAATGESSNMVWTVRSAMQGK